MKYNRNTLKHNLNKVKNEQKHYIRYSRVTQFIRQCLKYPIDLYIYFCCCKKYYIKKTYQKYLRDKDELVKTICDEYK